MDNNILLIDRFQNGDKNSLETLCKENMPLVTAIASRFSGRGTLLCDLIQIGSVGLIKAIRAFDTTKGVKFSTYAVPVITGEIKRFLRDDGMIHISRTLKERKIKAKQCEDELRKTLSREPTLNEISAKTGFSVDELLEAFDACQSVESFDDITKFNNEFTQKDSYEDGVINKITVDQLLSKLDQRERQVIVLRYMEGKTQQEIANLIGVSQVHISRIERSTLKKLRSMTME